MNEKKYLDEIGLSRFIQKIKSMFAPLSHTHTKSQITDFPSSLKNPSSLTFTGGVSGTYDGSSETVVEIPTTMKGATTTNDGASGLVTTPPKGASNRYLRSDGTWSVPPDTNTIYSNATTESDGLMSSDDKNKLDGIADGANNYIHPDYTAKTNGLYKVTIDEKGHVSETSSVTKADITALGIPGENTAYGTATDKALGVTKLYSSVGENTDGSITQKSMTDILSKKAEITHDHTISNITGLQDSLDTKAAKTHTHVISDVADLQSTLDGKAPSVHTHDDRYYTETEIDTKLAKKSDSGHIHSAADITSGTLGADRLPAIPVGKLSGVIDSSNLPSYVDDVLEYDTVSDFPKTGEAGKIYVATTTNLTYRWSGTGYVEISPSLALGTTSSTAYRGDLGNTAYVHSQITSGNPHKVTKSDVGLGNVDNTADANKSVKYATSAEKLSGNISGAWQGVVTTTNYFAVFDPSHVDDGYIRAMKTDQVKSYLGINDKLPLSGGTITGQLKVSAELSGASVDGIGSSNIIIIPMVNYSVIDSTHTDNTYFKELLKWICSKYPNKTDTIFVGSAIPNSANQVSIRIYSTSTVDTNGYPQYASGYYTTLGGNMLTFGFVNYVYYFKQMSDTTHTHNYVKDVSDGGNTTFAYSKDGLGYGDYSWLAGWNGKELRAVSKTQFAQASHSHGEYYTSAINRTANTVLAAPNGSAGSATFRKLVAADIPSLTKSKISDFPTSMPASDVYGWAKASTKPSYAWSEITDKPSTFTPSSHTHETVAGNYTGNGGRQNPSYISGATVRFNMMNTTINGDSNYKDFILMDTYGGGDVPYVTAFGIDKAAGTRAFIMAGKKGGSSWDYSAELISTANISSQSVNYATSAGSASSASSASTATTAAKLGRSGNTSNPMTFYWSGQSGQPTWLWGGTDGTNMYVYNPSNFSVNYASSAGSATSASYLNWVAGNEIRMNKPSTSATTLWIGYAWSDGSKSKLINRYNFAGGDGNLTEVAASTFVGALSGNATSATNADKLDGYHGSSSASASTYVLRDSNNYVWFNYINSNTSNSENPSISQVIVTNGSDNYYRKASLSHLKTSLGSMPASDVYSWAKASSKPSYSWSEITSKPLLTTTEFEALFK